MQIAQPSLFARHDTIFGACEAIGQDFGFNAQILRVALAGLLFWNPVAALAIYGVLAVTVLASRYLFPSPKASAQVQALRPERSDDAGSTELAAAA